MRKTDKKSATLILSSFFNKICTFKNHTIFFLLNQDCQTDCSKSLNFWIVSTYFIGTGSPFIFKMLIHLDLACLLCDPRKIISFFGNL